MTVKKNIYSIFHYTSALIIKRKRKNMFMKKALLVLCLLLAGGYTMNAQATFAPVGAEWWYGGNNLHGSFVNIPKTWFQHVQSVGDTVVAGTACRKLTITGTTKNATDPETVSSLFVYDNTDTVFVFSDHAGKFIPLNILMYTRVILYACPAYSITMATVPFVMWSIR
jgi:hypothetical protein